MSTKNKMTKNFSFHFFFFLEPPVDEIVVEPVVLHIPGNLVHPRPLHIGDSSLHVLQVVFRPGS